MGECIGFINGSYKTRISGHGHTQGFIFPIQTLLDLFERQNISNVLSKNQVSSILEHSFFSTLIAIRRRGAQKDVSEPDQLDFLQ